MYIQPMDYLYNKNLSHSFSFNKHYVLFCHPFCSVSVSHHDLMGFHDNASSYLKLKRIKLQRNQNKDNKLAGRRKKENMKKKTKFKEWERCCCCWCFYSSHLLLFIQLTFSWCLILKNKRKNTDRSKFFKKISNYFWSCRSFLSIFFDFRCLTYIKTMRTIWTTDFLNIINNNFFYKIDYYFQIDTCWTILLDWFVFAFVVGLFCDSVITDEIVVVSGWISYEPSGNFVHNVKATCDLSSWYLVIKSFGAIFPGRMISKIQKIWFWQGTKTLLFVILWTVVLVSEKRVNGWALFNWSSLDLIKTRWSLHIERNIDEQFRVYR